MKVRGFDYIVMKHSGFFYLNYFLVKLIWLSFITFMYNNNNRANINCFKLKKGFFFLNKKLCSFKTATDVVERVKLELTQWW